MWTLWIANHAHCNQKKCIYSIAPYRTRALCFPAMHKHKH